MRFMNERFNTRTPAMVALLLAVFSNAALADNQSHRVGQLTISLVIPQTHNVVTRDQDGLCLNGRNDAFSFQLQPVSSQSAFSQLSDSPIDCRNHSGQLMMMPADSASGVYYLLVAPE